jgi:hypothetical protein
MAKYITSLNAGTEEAAIGFGGYSENSTQSRFRKILLAVAGVTLLLVIVAAAGSYFYWQSLKGTPQYSLALIIDAARKNDQPSMDRLVDIGAVVDDFIPQITSKAVEIYGRGLPPQTIARVAQVAAPVMPAVKDRARAELPGVIRRKTARFENVPFAAMVIGADRYLDVTTQGNVATVKSLLPEQSFEFKMMREGGEWKIVGVRDNELSERIAKAIGQEVIAAATTNGSTPAGERLGIKNLNELLKNAEEALK